MKRKPRAVTKKLANGTTVVEGGEMRKVRSPRSGQYAHSTTTANGTKVYKTANGQVFTSKPLD